MLELVESKSEKAALQKQLESTLRKAWKKRETTVIAWRPNRRRLEIAHDGTHWFASVGPDASNPIPRYWNSFGEYKKAEFLPISVEINIASDANTGWIAGFYARDRETGVAYLMHDGSVGGGRSGVSRANYLKWSFAEPVPVVDGKGKIRSALIVAAIGARSCAGDIGRFVQSVIDFKKAITQGYKPPAGDGDGDNDGYYDEFSGKKKRKRTRELEYVTRHGEIVKELRAWREQRMKPGERIVKWNFIDLGVKRGGDLVEIYEVKPSSDRQSLYTAIGQILVHESPKGISKRFVVIPDDDAVPADVARAFERANIVPVRFRMTPQQVTILD
jgi:hypothetical protein